MKRNSSVCPYCREHLGSVATEHSYDIPPGIYNPMEFSKILQDLNVELNTLSPRLQSAIEIAKKYHEKDREIVEKFKKLESNFRQTTREELKKTDPNKYKLFYGNK